MTRGNQQMNVILYHISVKYLSKQESISVGCVRPTCQLYVLWWPPLGVSTQGVGIPGPMSGGGWVYTHPTDIPIPQTYPPPGHTQPHPQTYAPHEHTPWTYPLTSRIYPTPSPGHIHPPAGRDLGPGIPIPLVNRHTPEKILPSRNYCCGG